MAVNIRHPSKIFHIRVLSQACLHSLRNVSSVVLFLLTPSMLTTLNQTTILSLLTVTLLSVSTMWYSMSLSKKLLALLQTCCLLPTQAAVFEGVKINFLIACAPTFLSTFLSTSAPKKKISYSRALCNVLSM